MCLKLYQRLPEHLDPSIWSLGWHSPTAGTCVQAPNGDPSETQAGAGTSDDTPYSPSPLASTHEIQSTINHKLSSPLFLPLSMALAGCILMQNHNPGGPN